MLFHGFPETFVRWILECLSTVSYTFNVNGELTEPLKAKRGLRQGDPISPYLFVLCMEYLSRCLNQLQRNPHFKFHPRCKKLNLTHVCFADDLLLFTRGDLSSVRAIYEAFTLFSSASGLKANMSKSSIYFGGVDITTQSDILDAFQFSIGTLPFKYLGAAALSLQRN